MHLKPATNEVLLKLAEVCPVGIVAVDRSGTIVVTNKAVEQLFGYAQGELLGCSIEILVPEQFRLNHPQLREGYWQSLDTRPMGKGRDLFGVDKLGRKVPVEIGLAPFKVGDETFVLATIVDLTERKRLEAKLRRSSEETQVILDSLPAMVLFRDIENRILRVNQAVANSLGLTREEIEGRDFLEVYPEDADRFHRNDLEVIQSGQAKLGYIQTIDDRWVQTDKIPIHNSAGEVEKIIVVATDITELKRAIESEKSLQRLLEKTSQIAQVGGWEVDLLNSKNIIWSSEICRIHEVPQGHQPTLEEAISFYVDESSEIIEQALRNGIDHHLPWDVEAIIRTAKGNLRRVRSVGVPEIVDGECVRLWGTLQDITRQKESETRLKLMQRAVDLSADAVFFIREDGSFSYANEQASKYLQYSQEELLKMNVGDIDPAYPIDRWSERWDEVERAGLLTFESQHLRKDRTTYDCEIRTMLLEFAGERLVVALVRDITESKQAQEELAASEDRISWAMANGNLGLWDWDVKTSEVLFNATTKTQLGYPADSVWNSFSEWESRLHPEDREEALACAKALAKNPREPYESIFRMRTASGDYRWIRSVGKGVFDSDGELKRCVGVYIDITELKQRATELEQAIKELEQFAYIASHDLKAPLRAVDNLANWLKDDLAGRLPEASERHLDQLKQRASRMEKLLDDLLDYSRAGREETESTEIDLSNMIRDCVEFLDASDQFEITTELEIQRITGHKTPLATMIRNLIGNAIKHHDKVAGNVVVSATIDSSDATYCKLVIADDGPGIEDDFRNKAFMLFQTLKPRDEVEGSGMGLALAKKLVESEGGKIWIEANAPRGTRVCFTWPRRVLQ